MTQHRNSFGRYSMKSISHIFHNIQRRTLMLKRDKETPENPRNPLNFAKFFAEHLCMIASEKTTSTTTILGSVCFGPIVFP